MRLSTDASTMYVAGIIHRTAVQHFLSESPVDEYYIIMNSFFVNMLSFIFLCIQARVSSEPRALSKHAQYRMCVSFFPQTLFQSDCTNYKCYFINRLKVDIISL